MNSPDHRLRLSPAEVTEQQLPGIGRRYELTAAEGGDVSVVLHHSGWRDVYILDPGRDVPRATVTLSDSQARTLGAILGGAYFKPAVVEEIEAVVGELLIDWVTIKQDSPAAGRTIAELEVRGRTGMTIAAIVRDHRAMVAPDPAEVLHPGDRLVVLGRPEDLGALVRLVVG
jgi:TrkA domain protein